MKAVDRFIPSWNATEKDWSQFGEILHEIDESEAYEEDECKVLKSGRRYTILQATGCSCWDGDWEGWTDLTLAELRKIAEAWSRENYGSAKTMGEWIKDNL